MGLQRTLSSWLALLTRVLGFAGCAYELFGDKLRNPTALVVFGGLAGLSDVFGYRIAAKKESEADSEKQEPS